MVNDLSILAKPRTHKIWQVTYQTIPNYHKSPFMCTLTWLWLTGNLSIWFSAREVFGHSRSRSLVILNSTGYMLTSSGFALIHLRYILLEIPLKRLVIVRKSPTLTAYFSNSTGSSITNRRFSPDIDSVHTCQSATYNMWWHLPFFKHINA